MSLPERRALIVDLLTCFPSRWGQFLSPQRGNLWNADEVNRPVFYFFFQAESPADLFLHQEGWSNKPANAKKLHSAEERLIGPSSACSASRAVVTLAASFTPTHLAHKREGGSLTHIIVALVPINKVIMWTICVRRTSSAAWAMPFFPLYTSSPLYWSWIISLRHVLICSFVILYKKRHEFKSFTVRFPHFYTFICNTLPGPTLLWVERLKKTTPLLISVAYLGARLTQENLWFSLTSACHVSHPRFCDLKGLKWHFISLHIIKPLCFAAYLRETSFSNQTQLLCIL